jgi:hypothetical protein
MIVDWAGEEGSTVEVGGRCSLCFLPSPNPLTEATTRLLLLLTGARREHLVRADCPTADWPLNRVGCKNKSAATVVIQ